MPHLEDSGQQLSVLSALTSSDTGSGFECTLSAFAGTTELSGVVDVPEEWNAIQGNLENAPVGAP